MRMRSGRFSSSVLSNLPLTVISQFDILVGLGDYGRSPKRLTNSVKTNQFIEIVPSAQLLNAISQKHGRIRNKLINIKPTQTYAAPDNAGPDDAAPDAAAPNDAAPNAAAPNGAAPSVTCPPHNFVHFCQTWKGS
ncbi:hypothetical protein PoB_002656900 [Plakobranchus ocellatus]|uniref:Uncharacterized protein n=1 Tax=Plakobranchus ocellatus TaxID=259542 RepID=A0AAV3ZXL5_9GAST|nr:hypothetical protein PoB_002656900 [Plakobranchus ocellatus]